jgi:hypothetical protein
MTRALMPGAVIVVTLALAGCYEAKWAIPPGVSQAQYERDKYECDRDAKMAAGHDIASGFDEALWRHKCMRSKGYERSN